MSLLIDVIRIFICGTCLGSVYAFGAMGLAFIFGVMGVVNFAHGDNVIYGAFLSIFLFILFGIPPYFALPLVFLGIFAMGVAIYWLVIRHVIGMRFGIQVFTTFGLMFMLRYGALTIFGTQTINFSIMIPWAGTLVNIAGLFSVPLTSFIASFAALAAIFILHLFLNRTWTGLSIILTASDTDTAQLMGIHTNKVYAMTFGIASGVAGIGGTIAALNYPMFPTGGGTYGIMAFVIVALGGLGSVKGAYVGGLIIGIIQMMSALFIPGTLQVAVAYAVFLVTLMIRPSGLFKPIGAAYKKMRGEWA